MKSNKEPIIYITRAIVNIAYSSVSRRLTNVPIKFNASFNPAVVRSCLIPTADRATFDCLIDVASNKVDFLSYFLCVCLPETIVISLSKIANTMIEKENMYLMHI